MLKVARNSQMSQRVKLPRRSAEGLLGIEADEDSEALQKLASRNGASEETVDHLREELAQAHNELKFCRAHDALTGLPNRLALDCYLRNLADEQLVETSIGALAIDVDHFQEINERFGCVAGDIILKWIAAVLRDELSVPCFIARTGGDEFVVIFTGLSGEEELFAVASRIAHIVRRPFLVDGVVPSVSIGMYFESVKPVDCSSAWSSAVNALYQAKRGGRAQMLMS